MNDQTVVVVSALAIAVLMWYVMNPPKKEKCCMI